MSERKHSMIMKMVGGDGKMLKQHDASDNQRLRYVFYAIFDTSLARE